MPRAVARFEDTQRALETLSRNHIVTLTQPGIRERMQIPRRLVMVRAEIALGDGQSPLFQGNGLAELPEVRQRGTEEQKGPRDSRVIGSQCALGDCNGTFRRGSRFGHPAFKPQLLRHQIQRLRIRWMIDDCGLLYRRGTSDGRRCALIGSLLLEHQPNRLERPCDGHVLLVERLLFYAEAAVKSLQGVVVAAGCGQGTA